MLNYVTKDSFCEHIERTYQHCTRQDVKIVIDDFDAKLSKQAILSQTVEKISFRNETFPNGLKLIDFAAAGNIVNCITGFHKVNSSSYMAFNGSKIPFANRSYCGRRKKDRRGLRKFNIDSDHNLA